MSIPPHRRTAVRLLSTGLLGVCALLGASTKAFAQQSYQGPITLVVGFPPGGSADLGARMLAEKLPALLNQPVVVENRAGAGGQIAARYVKGAPDNGSVLFFTNGHTVVTVPLILKAPGFDTTTDLRPVSPFSGFEIVLVAHPSTQAHTLKALTDYFAKTPGARHIAVPAPGSSPEFMAGRLAQLVKLDIVPVAYKGAAPAVQDLVGGQVSTALLPVADVLQYVKAGRLNALAVTQTSELLPGVLSFADAGYGELGASDFLAVYAPAGMNDANVQRFNTAINRVLAMPDVKEHMLAYAMQPQPGGPQDLARRHEASRETVQRLMTAVGCQPQ